MVQNTVTWFTNLLANRESKKANYGRFWAVLGHCERIANFKSELTDELCYNGTNIKEQQETMCVSS